MSEIYINHLKENIKGYHLLNDSVLNETNWGVITKMTMEKTLPEKRTVEYMTKTSKISSTINLSSYRLTNSCDSVKDLVKEIDENRSPSGDMMYFVLLKKEDKLQYRYQFFIIPHSLAMFQAKNYKWNPTFGKSGKYKGIQNGWKGDFDGDSDAQMKISFGTTYQLWYCFRASELTDYKVCEFIVEKPARTLTYGDIWSLSKQSLT
ncbi:uncharacterized protein METZ01_LOCUS389064 [marine metagenome]|uniref:Uncharacterized protein n=1 Tax=marine metagenome TaxID=408172 RepID=A0A382UPR9_9ZZZZ